MRSTSRTFTRGACPAATRSTTRRSSTIGESCKPSPTRDTRRSSDRSSFRNVIRSRRSSRPTRFAMSKVARASHVVTIVAAVLVAGACHAAKANGDELTPSQRQVGVYRFSDRISTDTATTETIDLEGQFVVLGDTITVEARPGPCRYDTRTTLGGPILYQCGQNLTLSFDRHQPIARATYRALVTFFLQAEDGIRDT